MDAEGNGEYQLRTIDGSLRFFDTTKALLEYKGDEEEIEKISFNASDGARIRLLHMGGKVFKLTIWNGETYEVF